MHVHFLNLTRYFSYEDMHALWKYIIILNHADMSMQLFTRLTLLLSLTSVTYIV